MGPLQGPFGNPISPTRRIQKPDLSGAVFQLGDFIPELWWIEHGRGVGRRHMLPPRWGSGISRPDDPGLAPRAMRRRPSGTLGRATVENGRLRRDGRGRPSPWEGRGGWDGGEGSPDARATVENGRLRRDGRGRPSPWRRAEGGLGAPGKRPRPGEGTGVRVLPGGVQTGRAEPSDPSRIHPAPSQLGDFIPERRWVEARSHAQSRGGCHPASTHLTRARTNTGRLSSSAWTVARPVAVRPAMRVPESTHEKCSFQG